MTNKNGKKVGYVDSKELEACWTEWLATGSDDSWGLLLDGIYKICHGVAVKFHPRDDEEHAELAHEAFVPTMLKISDGRLKFEPGRAPVFNLLTTTIFRHLYSKMNKDSRRRRIMLEYRNKLSEDPAATS